MRNRPMPQGAPEGAGARRGTYLFRRTAIYMAASPEALRLRREGVASVGSDRLKSSEAGVHDHLGPRH
jgi:hypothetical protein